MKNRKILIGVFLFALFTIVLLYRQQILQMVVPERQTNTTPITPEAMKALPPLPKSDEATLQKQLQDIVKGGKVSDCANLSDPRYQYACHDFFKMKK